PDWLVRLRDVRVGCLQLDLLLPSCADRGGPRARARPSALARTEKDLRTEVSAFHRKSILARDARRASPLVRPSPRHPDCSSLRRLRLCQSICCTPPRTGAPAWPSSTRRIQSTTS